MYQIIPYDLNVYFYVRKFIISPFRFDNTHILKLEISLSKIFNIFIFHKLIIFKKVIVILLLNSRDYRCILLALGLNSHTIIDLILFFYLISFFF